MDVLLPSELERFVAEQIRSGLFPSAIDVILEGLKLLKERDEARSKRIEDLRREVRLGIDQAQAGRVSTFNESTLEAVKARGRRRLAASPGADAPRANRG